VIRRAHHLFRRLRGFHHKTWHRVVYKTSLLARGNSCTQRVLTFLSPFVELGTFTPVENTVMKDNAAWNSSYRIFTVHQNQNDIHLDAPKRSFDLEVFNSLPSDSLSPEKMSPVTIDPNLCALAAIAVFASYIYLRKPSPTPPGPPGLPLIGNILDFPKKESWKVYLQWGQQYSEFLKSSELMVNAHWLSRQRYP